MALSTDEGRICDEIEQRADQLVALASDLIAFDTTARGAGDAPRAEAPLQEYLAERLRAAGAEIDLWEPDAARLAGMPLVPPGLDFAGRPQLVARFPGTGGGRTLLFNGHIDVVSVEPRERWTSDPFAAEVRDGKLYGRGACDMKGGIAAMTLAAETLASLGVPLAGDLVLATNTDEESSGAGGTAIVERGVRADAGIVTEATGFDVWVACRGSEYAVVRVPGRPGHAEVRQPDWRAGGAVNAIEKATVVIDAIRSLRGEWAARDGLDHPYLSRPALLPTMAAAGEWPVTYPATCDLTIAVMYLPRQADATRDSRVGASRRDDARGNAGRGAPRPPGRTRLLVRRRHAHEAGGHPLDRLRPTGLRRRRAQPRAHGRRVRSGRRPRRVRARARSGSDAVLRSKLTHRKGCDQVALQRRRGREPLLAGPT